MGKLKVATLLVSLVLVAEEELVGALLGAENPPEGPDRAVVARPFEADGTLLKLAILVVDLAANTLHLWSMKV